VVATPKHFAVHSGPEGLRHSFDAVVSEKDLRETYLPAFHQCVTEGKAHSVMAAYNRTNGEPCSGSPTLLRRILREEWGFDGYVVSDCWAIKDFHENHKVTKSSEESAAMAVQAGCDLNCGCTYEHIPDAVAAGLLTESDLDLSVKRLFRARMRLGMFDPPAQVPFASIPYEMNDTERNRGLALVAARESIVLLKNEGALLPLRRDIRRLAVIGPNAQDHKVLLGNYHGKPSRSVTPLEGIRAAVSAGSKIRYAEGCKLLGTKEQGLGSAGILSEAVSMAERSDAVVLCLGLSADIEGEEGDASNSEAAGDRTGLALPGLQQKLMEQVVAVGKPTVLILLNGSPLAIGWAHEHLGAILQAWYPGEEGGTAIADVLFGRYSPAGRLPITFPRAIEDVPEFTDYRMKGRTYRYLEREPLYPFGYGLSYAKFEYRAARLSNRRIRPGDSVEVSAEVGNVSAREGDEVVQLYVEDLEASCVVPVRELRGFERVTLEPGEWRPVNFTLRPRDLSLIDDNGKRVLEPGRFRLTIGGSQPDSRSIELSGGRAPLELELEVEGEPTFLPY
jgi:beta-glucosidase